MVFQITNPLLVDKIDELISEIRFELPPERIKELIVEGLKGGEDILLVEEKNEEMTGFIFASPVYFEGDPCLYIQFSYIRKGNPNTGHEFMARLRQFAKENKLKRLIFVTHRRPEGFMRKYKFNLEGYLLSQEVSDE